jgi:hypothetical protein
MRTRNLALGLLALGVSMLITEKAAAFPLYLKSVSGTITYTPSYKSLYNTNVAKLSTVSVNMKTIMTVVSNQVFQMFETNAPAGSVIAFDPYKGTTYLTNKSGFYANLSEIVYIRIREVATAFRTKTSGIVENDVAVVDLDIYGDAPDGTYFEFEVYGKATVQYNVNKQGIASMRVSMSRGSDYGEYKGSDEGVSVGGFTFSGSGPAEWDGPFSTGSWW